MLAALIWEHFSCVSLFLFCVDLTYSALVILFVVFLARRDLSWSRQAHSLLHNLAKCSIIFMQRCLSSDSYAVRFIANYDVYVGRMFSPIGHNAFFCCSRYGFSTGGDLVK